MGLIPGQGVLVAWGHVPWTQESAECFLMRVSELGAKAHLAEKNKVVPFTGKCPHCGVPRVLQNPHAVASVATFSEIAKRARCKTHCPKGPALRLVPETSGPSTYPEPA